MAIPGTGSQAGRPVASASASVNGAKRTGAGAVALMGPEKRASLRDCIMSRTRSSRWIQLTFESPKKGIKCFPGNKCFLFCAVCQEPGNRMDEEG